jgi:hypothetical protein
MTHVTWEFHQVRPKRFLKAMVRLVQTVDLCCTDTNTISKRTKTRFYMTHVTLELHQVRPK